MNRTFLPLLLGKTPLAAVPVGERVGRERPLKAGASGARLFGQSVPYRLPSTAKSLACFLFCNVSD